MERTPSEAQRRMELVGVAVRRGVAAPLERLEHHGGDLVLAVLVHPDGIRGRGHATRAHDLDEVRAAPEFLARGLDHLGDAVGDDAHRLEGTAGAVAAMVVDLAEVAMSPGHGEEAPRIEEAWSPDQPVAEGLREPVVGTARIAHRREPAVERVAQHAGGVCRAVGGPMRLDHLHVHVGGVGMDVRVDQAGHQRPAPQVDAARGWGRDRAVGDLADNIILHQHLHAGGALGVHAIEEAGIGQQDLGHGAKRRGIRGRCPPGLGAG